LTQASPPSYPAEVSLQEGPSSPHNRDARDRDPATELRRSPQELSLATGRASSLIEEERLAEIHKNLKLFETFREQGDLPQSTAVLESIPALLLGLPVGKHTALKVSVSFNLAALYSDQDKFEAVESHAIEGLRLLKSALPHVQEGCAGLKVGLLSMLAESWSALGRSQSDVECVYSQAHAAAATLPPTAVIPAGGLQCVHGAYCAETGRIDDAVAYYERGLDIYRWDLDKAITQYAQHGYSLVNLYLSLRVPERAEALLDEILKVCEGRLSERSLSTFQFQRAILFAYRLDFDRASDLADTILTADYTTQLPVPPCIVILRGINAFQFALDGFHSRAVDEILAARAYEKATLGEDSPLLANFIEKIRLAASDSETRIETISEDFAALIR
jgi:tetratricopeptide (TPR) repeat protein